MNGKKEKDLIHCGRRIAKDEIRQIVETAGLFPKLSLSELSDTISENLSWYTASGRTKTDACRTLLEKLEVRGLLELPKKRKYPAARSARSMPCSAGPLAETPIVGKLGDLGDVVLEVAEDDESKALFEYCVSRYHYLGYKHPFGCYMHYFFRCRRGLLGCALFAGAARAIAKRDEWIGWDRIWRSANLGFVVNNSRFLIFPWVRVDNLASRILGGLRRRLPRDWRRRWRYSPVLMETFVDPSRFEGTCYKAANWKYLGRTTGIGLARRGKSCETMPRKIFVRELRKDFRKRLCGGDFRPGGAS
jgi:hypothetical protein